MFVRLTRYNDGRKILVNASLASGITPQEDHTCIWCCDTEREPFEVKENVDMVAMLFEDALKGGNK